MINGRKTIGLILCGVTGNYQKDLCRSMIHSAGNRGYDLLVFNIIGTIGRDYKGYADHENNFAEIIPFDKLDAVIFDNSNVVVREFRELLYEKLSRISCPVILIGFPNEDFYEVHFDNLNGIAEMVDHFVEHHGFTKIGYMSGIKDHVDSVQRLEMFRNTMKKHGLNEDGVGIFHGDFWYNYGEEAADYFWNKCGERPQAVICANDYMAVSLCDAFENMGVKVPEMISVSGCDGVYEAKMHCPGITTVDKDNSLMSEKCLEIIEDLRNGRPHERVSILPTTNRYLTSCGCVSPADDDVRRKANESFANTLEYLYYIYDTESAMLEMNKIDSAEEIEDTFAKYGVNIGLYDRFFVFAYVDDNDKKSYEQSITAPTKMVYPALWIDKIGTTVRPEKFDVSTFLPADTSSEPLCCYISHIHFGEHCFGYSVIQMHGDEPFNEFYKIWMVNIAVSFETLLHKNSIRALVSDLEKESTHDRLTGLLNRRGFEQRSDIAFREICNYPERSLGAIMIDMDRLKNINDIYGHAEGDFAIRKLAELILSCCENGEIAGRTGGDEFYVLAPDYDQEKAERFADKLEKVLAEFNASSGKEYTLNASCGYFVKKVADIERLEDLLKKSDEKMYSAKRKKYSDIRYN